MPGHLGFDRARTDPGELPSASRSVVTARVTVDPQPQLLNSAVSGEIVRSERFGTADAATKNAT
jgi:hypothetical protein